jgi:hypothetical protein
MLWPRMTSCLGPHLCSDTELFSRLPLHHSGGYFGVVANTIEKAIASTVVVSCALEGSYWTGMPRCFRDAGTHTQRDSISSSSATAIRGKDERKEWNNGGEMEGNSQSSKAKAQRRGDV